MKTIFDETRINSMVLKNRLVRSATWENMADENGHMTEKLFKVYEELAQGGVGMIISGCTFVMPGDQFYPGMMGMWEDSFVAEYRRLTDMVHSHGSRMVQQLAYGGTQGTREAGDLPVWGPSDVADLATGNVPTPMGKEDIRTLVKAFGDAAVRSKAAGFDGVELHGSHGYLLGQFLSPHYNRRSDEYGGSIENRARIYVELYEEIRGRVGKEFSIMVKINSDDYIENGATFEDCRYVCRKLAELGIDALEISGGTGASADFMSRTKINSPEKEAYHAESAARIASEVQVPVILVGGVRSPGVMEALLGSTGIEYFSFARPLLAEPDLPSRWQHGDRSRARCVSCNGCQGGAEGNICILKDKFAKSTGTKNKKGAK